MAEPEGRQDGMVATMDLEKRDELAGVVEKVVVGGDLSKLTPSDRLTYYKAVCQSVGLNPLTRPFDYINLSGRLVLYAKRDATDQLRALKHVSITKLERETVGGIYTVTAYASTADGRQDSAIGAVAIENLKGEAFANAVMKCETKAKRRVTLSICGLGMLDEAELEAVADAEPARVNTETGELLDAAGNVRDIVDDDVERDVLLGRITAQADLLRLDAKRRAELWEKYVPGTPTNQAKSAPVSYLNDLYAELVKLAGAK